MRIIVTGGAGGIGRQIVRVLSEAGHSLLSCDLAHEHEGVTQRRLDVTDEAQVAALFGAEPALDAVIHCAGIGIFKPFDELTAGDWRRLLDINVIGAFLVSQAAARTMRSGRIIHFGSVANTRALDGSAAYGASKAALAMMCKSMNHELGVRATFLTLGAVYTPIWESRPEFSASDMLSVDDVARVVRNIVESPLHMRIDEMTLLPPKGIL
jgi:NAD(P)-dependent dehydrogenase (short-subunit alcohol dehydrogenase family)